MSVPVRYSAAVGANNLVIDSDMKMNGDMLQQQHHHQMSSIAIKSSADAVANPCMMEYPNNDFQQQNNLMMNNHQMMMTNNGENAEMRNQWMMMPDVGRLGTPDADAAAGGSGIIENNNNEFNMMDQQRKQFDNNNTVTVQQKLCENDSSTAASAISSRVLFDKLKEYDTLQDKYHTVLLLPRESTREVTAGGRDGAAYVLRCLKMWYELPSDVLFAAMGLVDRFLDRMTVKPKHVACMSVASFHLAIKQLGLSQIPPEDLVTISQCGCTAGDVERMANVICSKLGVQLGQPPITPLSFLRIYYQLFLNWAEEMGGEYFKFFQQFIKLEELEMRLEVLLCDVKTTVVSPSTLALVLVCLHMDFHIKESYPKRSPELKDLFEYILFLQKFLRIPDRVFTCGFSVVSEIVSHYNGQNKQPYKQRLVWKLSSRTLRVLRPTNRFSSDLPTIEEGNGNPGCSGQQQTIDEMDGCRSRTESLSSEEEEDEDWPTSPIIPIFEQC